MARIDQRLGKPKSTGTIGNVAGKPAGGLSDAVLSSKIAAILNANAPESYKQQALANAPTAKAPEAWWETALNTLGKPKTLVVASLRRALDPNANWMNDVRNNVGAGKLVEKAPLPDVVKGAIGFVGDIALDPLTYVGVGVADDALKMGGKGANLFFKAAKYSDEIGKTDDAIKFATAGQKAAKGLSNLSGTERQVLRELATSEAQRVGTQAALGSAALKESGGLYLNVPGTGSVTNKLRSMAGISPVQKRQIKLLSQSDALSSIPRTIRKGEEIVRSGRLGQGLAKSFTAEEKIKLINTLRRGDDPLKAADAFIGLKALNVGPAAQVKFAKDATESFYAMVEDLKAAGIDLEDATRAAGGDANAFARVEAKMGTEKALAVQEWSRDIGRLYNDIAGFAEGEIGSLPIRDLHAATMRTDELKARLGQGFGNDTYDLPGAVKGANFEKKALRPGDTFLDTELVAPASHPEGLSIPDQMENIAKDYFGADYVKMFNQDFEQAGKAMIEAMSKRMRTASIEKYLRDAGVAKDLFDTVLTGAAKQARKNLTKVLNKLPAARQAAAGSYMEVENTRQAYEAADALVMGSKEQAAVWRAEARIDRLSQKLLGENSSDPVMKGLYSKLRNAKSAEEAAATLGQMQDEVIRQFPDEANEILRPLRELLDESSAAADDAFGVRQGWVKKLDELDDARAKTVEYHNTRYAMIREYADLIQRRSDLNRIVRQILAEINSPTAVTAAERDALTLQMQTNLKSLTDKLNKLKELRAYLEAPELMTGPAKKGAFKAGDAIDEKTGRVSSAGTVKTSSVGGPGVGGESEVALYFFLNHPDINPDAIGLKKLVNESFSLEDLTVRQREAVVREANRIVDDLQRQVESYDVALRKRMETSPQTGLRQAQEELDRVAARLQELGKDEYVAYLGDLKARLPELDERGFLVDPLIYENFNAAKKWASKVVPASNEAMKDWSIESIMNQYLLTRVERTFAAAERKGLLNEIDDELENALSMYDELRDAIGDYRDPDFNFEVIDDVDGIGVDDEIRALNEFVEERFFDEVSEVSIQESMPWGGTKMYHGGSTTNTLNLTLESSGKNFANADSIAGTHWAQGEADGLMYASFSAEKGGDGFVVTADLAPKNTFVYGPRDVDLYYGTPYNFDFIGSGEWTGGRAVYFGDVLRDAVQTGRFNRSMLRLRRITKEQRAFFRDVFDFFDETGDAAEALRRAAANHVTDAARENYRAPNFVRDAVGDYDNFDVDYIAREIFAASPDERKNPLVRKLPLELVETASKGYNETLKAMGYDSIAYTLGYNKGWAVIAIDPAIIKVRDARVFRPVNDLRRTITIKGPQGKVLAKTKVGGRKAIAFDMFDAEQTVAKAMAKKQDELVAKIDDAREKVGAAVDRSTADWSEAKSKLDSDRAALAEAEADADQIYSDLLTERYSSYSDEVSLRRKAVRYGELIEERQAVFEAEMAQAQAQGVAANQALEDLRSEMGVLSLERDYAAAQADLAKKSKDVLTLEDAAVKLRQEGMETRIANVLENGFSQLGMASQAPDHIVEAIQMMTKVRDPKQIGLFLKTFDWLTQAFKSWAIATPGFHFRNFMGGVFNNFLAGVDISSYKQFRKADRLFQRLISEGAERTEAYAAIGRRYGQLTQEAYQIAERSYAFGMPGQIGSTGIEAGIGDSSTSWRKAVTRKGSRSFVIDNPATRLNLHASEYVERQLRGTLAFDYAMKGAGADEALEAVYKFHFNYDDLSTFEKDVAKRVMPFYTWTRKNLPLQMEMLLQKPQYYANIGFFKNEMEQYSEKEGLTPAWFAKTLNIRMPFKNPMGEQMYMMPQLPPTDLQRLTNPREFLGMINPLIKVPVESITQKKLYNDVPFKEGFTPVPSAWNKLGIGPIMQMAGFARPDKDGNLVARDSDLYAVESFLPILGRARRLFPSDSQESEKKYSSRVMLSWANAIFGLGFTANTQSDQAGELYRRTKELDKINKELSSMGYGGFKTLTKDVATKQKPAKGEKSPYLIVATPKGGAGASYTAPKKGQSGPEALTAALNKLKSSKSSSPALQETIANLQKSRKN